MPLAYTRASSSAAALAAVLAAATTLAAAWTVPASEAHVGNGGRRITFVVPWPLPDPDSPAGAQNSSVLTSLVPDGSGDSAAIVACAAVSVNGRPPVACGRSGSALVGLTPGAVNVLAFDGAGAGAAVGRPADAVAGLSLSTLASTTGAAEPSGLLLTSPPSPPARGARFPGSAVYEAEDAGRCGGTVVGPTYSSYTDTVHLGSEASQRMACTLAPRSGQAVTLTLAAPANALRVRYSIPDSPSGGGTRDTLRVAVGSDAPFDVALTSEYSWFYGKYPFTNDPKDGMAHHFYDEFFVLLNRTAPAGTKLTLSHALNATPSLPGERAPPAPRSAADAAQCDGVPVPERKDCGFYGINESVCVQTRGCCWLPNKPPNPAHVPDCFHPVGPAPPPPPAGITIDVVNTYAVAPAPPAPPGSVSVVALGGDPTGVRDSTPAFIAGCHAAAANGSALWLPPGRYAMASQVTLPSHARVIGAGAWRTELVWAGQTSTGLFGQKSPGSVDVHLADFAIVGNVRQRCDACPANGVGGALTGGSTVQRLIVHHTKVGMWLDGPFSDVVIAGNIICDTTADGINLHGGVTNVTVTDNHVRNTGDDGIAQWSDSKVASPDAGNVVRFNTVQLPVLANCVALYGGANHTVTDNLLSDSVAEGGALHVGNRFTSHPLVGTSLLARNTLLRGGCLDDNWKFGVGSLWFDAQEEPITGVVDVEDTTVLDSPFEALHVMGEGVSALSVRNMTSNATGTFFFQAQCAVNVSFAGTRSVGNGFAGVYNCLGAKVNISLVGSGNSGGWWNDTKCGFPPGGDAGL